MSNNTEYPKYRHDIDGLRGIAVLSIVLYHYSPSILPGGYIGVDIFFVISGFLISTVLFQNIDRGSFSIGVFYSRRILRVFPALFLVLATVLAFGWFCLLPDELQKLGKHTTSSVSLIQNFTLWNEAGYFDIPSETKPLLHIWSLGIEEQFYILWPLFLFCISKLSEVRFGWRRHKRLFYFLATFLVFLASFILNLKLVSIDPSRTFYLPQYRFFELALGGLLSWWVLYQPKFYPAISDRKIKFWNDWLTEIRKKNILSLVGLTILITIFGEFNKETVFPGKNALLPIFATTFIIWAGPNAWLNRKILSHKILVWFGLISYPLYLWHWPILSFGRIIYGELPPLKFRLMAFAISILLSWLTFKFIEKHFRFGSVKISLKLATICLLMLGIGGVGFFINTMNFNQTRTYEKLMIQRKSFEFIIGDSFNWYYGKNDWLYLGNTDFRNVEKIIGVIYPTSEEINIVNSPFLNLAQIGKKLNTKIVLIIGPNKESIYPEYLPDKIIPSQKKYSSYFLDQLSNVPNLIVYNPTNDLLRLKKTEGILYWKTDTHWNNKGAYLVYSGFSKLLELPAPQVDFQHNGTHSGDLINIGKLQNFPLHPDDNWQVIWKKIPDWTEHEKLDGKFNEAAGKPSIVSNSKSLSNKKIWVIGDSFVFALKQYFNATFKEIRYLGHWVDNLNNLAGELENSKEKPDIIVIVRVERSF